MKRSRIETVIVITISYVALLSILVAWGLSYDSWQLKEHLKIISPIFMEINFFLVVVGVLLNIDIIKRVCKGITRRTMVVAALIAIGGTLITMFVAPRTHRIFYDEDIYLNVGQNIANLRKAGMCNEGGSLYNEYYCSRLEYNKDPNGWPYLTSLIFRIMGESHLACYMTNNFIWGLSILVVFFTGFLLFGDERAGVLGALIFALMPQGLIWSNTTAAEPSAAFFSGLAILSLVLFARNPETRALFLSSALISFAFQFRPESALVVLPAGLILLLLRPEEIRQLRVYVFLLLVLGLSSPHLIQIYAVKGEGWGAPGGSKFALKYFFGNLPVNSFFYIKNDRFPLIFTLLFFLGLAMPRLRLVEKGNSVKTMVESVLWKEKVILLTWFLAFWGIFLFFYAGSYNFGADVRFSVMSYMPIAVLAGFGAAALNNWIVERLNWEWVTSALTILILLWSLSFLPYIRAETQEAWGARADHRYAEIMAEELPPHSLVFTHNPNMFLLWGKNAAQASIATQEVGHMEHLFDRYHGGIYFHYGFWCNVSDPAQQSFCKRILGLYESTEVMSFQEQDYRYGLYRLEQKGK